MVYSSQVLNWLNLIGPVTTLFFRHKPSSLRQTQVFPSIKNESVHISNPVLSYYIDDFFRQSTKYGAANTDSFILNLSSKWLLKKIKHSHIALYDGIISCVLRQSFL